MKVKEGYMLREIAGSFIIVPVGNRVMEFNGMISLSESGALLWRTLTLGSEEEGLVELLLQEYAVDEGTAKADVKEYIDTLKKRGLMEE